MRHFRVFTSVLVLLFIIGFVAIPIVRDHLHTYYPTPETESAFFKKYTPTKALDRFREESVSSYGDSRGAAAGHDSVTNKATFDGYFALRSEEQVFLMDSLRDDAAAQLMDNGAHILSQGGDERSGFHFQYELGKVAGTVTISPLEEMSLMHRKPPLPSGMIDVHTSTQISETWFAKEPVLLQASSEKKVHPTYDAH